MGPVDVRKTGSFAGRFEEAVSTTFEFEYSQQPQVEAVEDVSYLDEAEWGQPGAVSPMGHGMGGGMDGPPGPGLPSAEEYPGRDLGTHTSDDAVFVVRYLEDSRLADGGGYLFVSARTPYNRIPLPGMALAVEGDVEGTLTQTLDGELGHHYGRAVTLDAGDTFDIVTQTPPQVARHRGYETAFLDVDPIPVEVP